MAKKVTSPNLFASAYDEYGGDEAEWAGGGGDGQEEWECVVCGKSFRSEKAWGNHERSNKHLKEVARCASTYSKFFRFFVDQRGPLTDSSGKWPERTLS